MALSRNIFEIFDVKEYNDLEIWVRSHSRSSKVTPFNSLHMISYYHPIVTSCLECTVSRYCDILVENRQKTYPTLILRPLPSEPRRISA